MPSPETMGTSQNNPSIIKIVFCTLGTNLLRWEPCKWYHRWLFPPLYQCLDEECLKICYTINYTIDLRWDRTCTNSPSGKTMGVESCCSSVTERNCPYSELPQPKTSPCKKKSKWNITNIKGKKTNWYGTGNQCFGSGLIDSESWIQHFMLNTGPDPDPIWIQCFDDQKLGKIYSWKKLIFFDQKLQFTYP